MLTDKTETKQKTSSTSLKPKDSRAEVLFWGTKIISKEQISFGHVSIRIFSKTYIVLKSNDEKIDIDLPKNRIALKNEKGSIVAYWLENYEIKHKELTLTKEEIQELNFPKEQASTATYVTKASLIESITYACGRQPVDEVYISLYPDKEGYTLKKYYDEINSDGKEPEKYVLYNLNIEKMLIRWDGLQSNLKSHTVLGKTFFNKSSNSCCGLVYDLLIEGGIEKLTPTSQVSSLVKNISIDTEKASEKLIKSGSITSYLQSMASSLLFKFSGKAYDAGSENLIRDNVVTTPDNLKTLVSKAVQAEEGNKKLNQMTTILK